MSAVAPDALGLLVAIDVGGTAIKALIIGENGRIVSHHTRESGRQHGPETVVQTVLRTVDELVASTKGHAAAVGLVVPGFVDEVNGIALDSENIGWANIHFRDLVHQRTGLPVGFGHDVRAGGFAEKSTGAGRASSNMLFLPIGTGIAAAMFVDSRAITNMYAGEIGHIDVGTGETCPCGGVGCLETIASGPAIIRSYERATGTRVAGAKDVVDLSVAGDDAAILVWDAAIDALAAALATYTSLLAPELIVVGGGLANAGPLLLEPLQSRLYARLAWQQKPQLVRAEHGEYASALGAAMLAKTAIAEAGA